MMKAKKVLFANAYVAVFDDGTMDRSFLAAAGWARPTMMPRRASNEEALTLYTVAARRGIRVTNPPVPAFDLPAGWAVGGTREEIESLLSGALLTLVYNPARDAGPAEVARDYPHGEWCQCGCWPEVRYDLSLRTVGDGWEVAPGTLPEGWLSKEGPAGAYVKVVSSNGAWSYEGDLGRRSGNGFGLTEAEMDKYQVTDPAVRALLRRRLAEWEAFHETRLMNWDAETDESLLADLARLGMKVETLPPR